MFVFGAATFLRNDNSWSNREHLCRWLFQLLGRALWNKRAPVYLEIQTGVVSSIGFFGKLKNFLKSHLFWEWELPSARGNEDFWDSLERRDGFLRSCTLPDFGWLGWNAVVKKKWEKCLDVPKISQLEVGVLAGE